MPLSKPESISNGVKCKWINFLVNRGWILKSTYLQTAPLGTSDANFLPRFITFACFGDPLPTSTRSDVQVRQLLTTYLASFSEDSARDVLESSQHQLCRVEVLVYLDLLRCYTPTLTYLTSIGLCSRWGRIQWLMGLEASVHDPTSQPTFLEYWGLSKISINTLFCFYELCLDCFLFKNFINIFIDDTIIYINRVHRDVLTCIQKEWSTNPSPHLPITFYVEKFEIYS
jgi:hypothetical protein